MTRAPYPLQWPPRVPRTLASGRQRSAFGGRTRDSMNPYGTGHEVVEELQRLGASSIVITSNLPSGSANGIPYAAAPAGSDPGIAVWFEYARIERAMACDCWIRPADNLRAIAKSIEAMRGLARWGVADVMASVFTGFALALPAGDPQPRTWREVFGILDEATRGLPREDLLAVVRARYRRAIGTGHPDAGGAPTNAAELNDAMAAAESELA